MAIQKDLLTPVSAGNIATLAAATLAVHCIFDVETGVFKVSALSLDVREGEITGTGPYEFHGHGGGSVEKPAVDIPAPIIADLEALFDKGLVLYAAQEGYEI